MKKAIIVALGPVVVMLLYVAYVYAQYFNLT